MAINFLNVTNTLPEIQINDTDNNPRLAFQESGVVSGGVSTTGGDLVLEASSGIERARILSTGNFGIGTATPTAARLVVASAGTDPQIMIKNTAGNNAIILLEDNSGGSQNASITFNQASQNTLTIATGYQSPSDLNRIYLAPAGNTVLTAIGGSGGISTAKVGIGTTSPGKKLEVKDTQYQLRLAGDNNYWNIGAGWTNYYDGSFLIANNTGDKFFISTTGSVGIGTNSPAKKLEVVSNTTYDGIQISGSSIPTFGIIDTTNNAKFVAYVRDSDATIGMETNHPLTINTNNAERIRITNAGNVGINTNNPITKFQITAANASSPTANIFLDIDGANIPGMGGQIIFGTSTSGTLTDYIARIQGVRSALDNGSSDLHFQTTHVATATGPTTKMTILSSGNVGIGTTSPGAELTTSGVIMAIANDNAYNSGYFAKLSSDHGANALKLTSRTGDVFLASNFGSSVTLQVGNPNVPALYINASKTVQFNGYDSTNQTGTATYLLGTDASGNVVKTLSTPGGDPGPYLPLAGGTMTGTNGVLMPDNFKLKFGDATTPDLQIYHDASNSYITDGGTGNLRIRSTSLRLENTDSSNMIVANGGGNVAIYYNGSAKFSTTNDGIQVTNTEGTQIRFVESDSSYTEAMRIIRYQDVIGFHYGDNANEEAFTIDNTGQATAHKNLTVSGKVITTEVESASTLLLDAAADITIDAGGQDIILSDDGTIFGTLSNTSGFQIRSRVNDASMFLRGVDGGTEFNALTLDMSDAGYATFNSGITATNTSFSGTMNIAGGIYHIGDTNTFFGFDEGNDTFRVVTGGAERLGINNSGVRIGGGARVTTILDEDNMASNSATALATQQSIKAYVDNSITGGANYLGVWDPDDSLNNGYGNPSLQASGRTDNSGDYFICSADGAAHPNGGTTEPDSWHTGDWVVWNEDLGSSGLWQKIDNTTVLSGGGTANKIPIFTDSETIGDSRFSQNSTTNIITGPGNAASDKSLSVTSAANTEQLYIQGTGEVVVSQNYFYVSASQGAYINGILRARSGVTDDTGTLGLGGNGSTTNLTLTSNTGAAFAGSVTLSSTGPLLYLANTTSTTGKTWRFSSAANGKFFITQEGVIDAVTLDHTTGNATFAGNVSIVDDKYFAAGTGGDLIIRHLSSDNSSYIQSYTGDFYFDNRATTKSMFFRVSNSSAGDTTAVTIKSNGNVGIGTTTPLGKLHVYNTATTSNGNGTASETAIGQDSITLYGHGGTNGQTYGSITWMGGSRRRAMISAVAENADTDFIGLAFYTQGTDGSGNYNESMRISRSGNVGIGTTSPTYKLTVSGGIEAGGKVTYTKSAGSLNTTGYAVAGITALPSGNGFSCGFTFTCFGGAGKYQKLVYSCYNSGGTWNAKKVIDEGTNDMDVVASANGATITFTFKARSSTQSFTPKVIVEAVGTSINSTYA